MPTRVAEVEHLEARVLRVTFSDGLVRELDFAGELPGILAGIDDDAAFGSAMVDPVAGTVCWPGGIDLDPEVLHDDHESAPAFQLVLLREYRLQEAG